MSNMTKKLYRTALVAIAAMTLTPLAASAGTWRLDPSRCPDLREDRYDRRHNDGWRDRREDRRDERVVRCPARAWYYVPDRYERTRYDRDYRPGYAPRDVYINRHGRPYYVDRGGSRITLDFRL